MDLTNTFNLPVQGSHDDGFPRAVQEACNLTPSEAAASTVYTASTIHRDDDAYTRVTSYTYASEVDAQQFVRRLDDRAFNALNETYFMPTDEDEWSRLDKQHIAITIAQGGLYAASDAVNALLAPQEGEEKRVIDLGCGTGVWTLEMAIRFPHARIIGIDLAPVPVDSTVIPSNLQFEIDDINLGLKHYENQIDVAHARLVGIGLRDSRKSVQDVIRCLKPGGLVIWLDGDYDMYTGYNFDYLLPATEIHPSGSYLQRILHEVRRAAMHGGQSDSDGMSHVLDTGLWDDPMIDPETCKTAALYLPIGPWAATNDANQSQQIKYVGSLMGQDFMSAHRATHALLKKIGWPPEILDEWSKQADKEIADNTHSIWLKIKLAWGRRRAAPGEPAPPLPLLTPRSPNDASSGTPYPFFYTYDTKEEAMRQTENRNRNKNIPFPLGLPEAT